ncbi:hypothetical protein ACQ4PT_019267 [Festuca glaucescens]
MWSPDEATAGVAFRSEIAALGSIRHRNIVRLLGWAANGGSSTRLLFYSYLPNGSLSGLLHGAGVGVGASKGAPAADWGVAHAVALGVAHAVAYLHHDCVPAILHGDIKSMHVSWIAATAGAHRQAGPLRHLRPPCTINPWRPRNPRIALRRRAPATPPRSAAAPCFRHPCTRPPPPPTSSSRSHRAAFLSAPTASLPCAWPPPPPSSSSCTRRAASSSVPTASIPYVWPPPPPSSSSCSRRVLDDIHDKPPLRVVAGSPNPFHVQPSEADAAASPSSTPPKVPAAPGDGNGADMAAATRVGRSLLQGEAGLATRAARLCYNRRPALLPAVGGASASGGRPCYKGREDLLHVVPGLATMDVRLCYKGEAALATGGGSSCYKSREALLQQASVFCYRWSTPLLRAVRVFSGDGFSG